VPLPGAGHPRQRPAPAVSQQVDLAGQPAPRPAQRLPILVIRLSPLHAPEGSARPAPAAPDRYEPAAHAAPRPHADAPAPPWHPPPPSTPARRPHRTRPAAGPGSSPRSRPRTSGDAGYRPSSSSRNALAGPATGTRSGSGRRSRRSPAGDHSTGAPAAAARAAKAPAAPTHHQSGHAASTAPHPPGNQSGNDPPRSTGHALAAASHAIIACCAGTPAGTRPDPAPAGPAITILRGFLDDDSRIVRTRTVPALAALADTTSRCAAGCGPLLAELTRTGSPAIYSRGRQAPRAPGKPGLSRRPAGGTGME
jgi:hypothetical protein